MPSRFHLQFKVLNKPPYTQKEYSNFRDAFASAQLRIKKELRFDIRREQVCKDANVCVLENEIIQNLS